MIQIQLSISDIQWLFYSHHEVSKALNKKYVKITHYWENDCLKQTQLHLKYY